MNDTKTLDDMLDLDNELDLLLSADAWKVKGNDATVKHDFKEAIDCYSQAIDLDPTNHVYFSNRSAAYLSKHDAANALADAENCIALKPSWTKGYSRKGAALYELGDFENSIKIYTHGLDMDPDNAHLKKALAGVKKSAQKYSSPTTESLYSAACTGDLPGINALVRMGCGLNGTVKENHVMAVGDYTFTPLGGAIRKGQTRAVKLLLNAGADCNLSCDYQLPRVPMSPIVAAVSGGEAGITQLLIQAGASIHAPTNWDDDRTLLHAAACYGHVEVARVLLAAGAWRDALTTSNKTPLLLAVEQGQAGVAQLLIDEGASVHATVYNDLTLLHSAAYKGHMAAARVLLAAGARVDGSGTGLVRTPLAYAVESGRTEMVKLLLGAGATANAHLSEDQRQDNCTLLHFAAAHGHVEMARLLLAAGAQLDVCIKEVNKYPITLAVEHGHAEMLKLLIKSGAPAHAPIDADQSTLLHFAAFQGHVEVAKVLLAAGVPVDTRTKDAFKLPISLAVEQGRVDIVQLLVNAGAAVNVQAGQCKDYMLLHSAVWKGHVEVARVLLAAGARVDARTEDGKTPLILASLQRNIALVNMLVKAGAGVDAVDQEGQTPLVASMNGRDCAFRVADARKVVRRLLKAGADVNVKYKSDATCTALHAAALCCCPDVVQDLLDAGADIDAKGEHGCTALDLTGMLPQDPTTVPPFNPAQWKRRVADTKAVLRGWKETREGGVMTVVSSGGAGAGAGAGAGVPGCDSIIPKDHTCGVKKVKGKGEKKKKKMKPKKGVKDENRVCDGPDCNSVGVNRCKACKRPAYCGAECQRAHWIAGHKQECKIWRESS